MVVLACPRKQLVGQTPAGSRHADAIFVVGVGQGKAAQDKRNEPLDLRNYATAALAISRPVLKKPDADGTPAQPVKKSRGRRQLSGGI